MVPVGSSKLSYLKVHNERLTLMELCSKVLRKVPQQENDEYFSLTALALRSFCTATGFDRSLNTRGSERSSSSEL